MPLRGFADRVIGRAAQWRRRGNAREAIAITLVMVFSALAFAVYSADPQNRAPGDSYWYMRQTELFRGLSVDKAEDRAGVVTCAEVNRSLRLTNSTGPRCVPRRTSISPRYIAIFSSRPAYPLIAVPFVSLFGLSRGMNLATGFVFVLIGLAGFAALRVSGLGRRACVVGACSLSVLPMAWWDSRMLAEGTALAPTLVCVAGAVMAWRGRRSGWWWLLAGLVVTAAAKPANGASLAVALAGAGLCLALVSRAGRRRGLALLLLGGVSFVVWIALSRALGLPSLTDTAQDLATAHFTQPDVADPFGVLRRWADVMWTKQIPMRLWLPWPYTVVLPAAVLAVLRLRGAGLIWAAAAMAPIAVATAHPMISQYARLISPAWIAACVAIAILVDRPRSNAARVTSRPTRDGAPATAPGVPAPRTTKVPAHLG